MGSTRIDLFQIFREEGVLIPPTHQCQRSAFILYALFPSNSNHCELLLRAPESDPLHVQLNGTESEAKGNHLEELRLNGNDVC